MAKENSCRLCFSADNSDCLNIFTITGNELKINEIISKHFKCDISEDDLLPNFVCHDCWTITESFHELYEKSKLAQEAFLNSIIKIEADPIVLYPESNDHEIETNAIKLEPNLEEEEEQDALESDEEIPSPKSNKKSNKKLRTSSKKTGRKAVPTFQKLFDENKHRLNLSCEKCTVTFESLDDAHRHYPAAHNIAKGYIRCTDGKCNVKLKYPCIVVQHLNHHLKPEKFKCDQCNKVLNTPHGYTAHMKNHSDPNYTRKIKKSLLCDVCKKKFATQIGLERHMIGHTREDTKTTDDLHARFIAENFDMTCDLCEATFTSFHDARNHYKDAHDEQRGYLKCCKMKLREPGMVTDHINSHLNPGIYNCQLCKKVFSSGFRFNQHMHGHRRSAQRSFICDICGKSFRDKETVLRHLFAKHVDSEPEFECKICQKRFRLESLLKNHMYMVHREKKPLVTCEICGKSFTFLVTLKKHKLTHIDKSERLAMREQCEVCGEWLMTKGGMYYHEQIHSKGIHKCDHCEAILPNRIALQSHVRKTHRERTHKCKYCDRAFPVSSELKKHEEGHTRHRTYPCNFCEKVFTVSTSRTTHQKRSHLEELEQFRKMRKLNQHLPT